MLVMLQDAISKKSFHPWLGWPPEAGVINYGDVKAAFATCDHVIEGEVRIGGQEHFYMETHGVRAVPKGEDGELDIYIGTQFGTETQVRMLSLFSKCRSPGPVCFDSLFFLSSHCHLSFGNESF